MTAVADDGTGTSSVYAGTAAWLVVLWALAGHRGTAVRLSRPDRVHLARAAVEAAARLRRFTAPEHYREPDARQAHAS